MSNIKNFITLSGGFNYHLKAFKNKKNWLPFKKQLHQFLNQWSPSKKSLNLIGPSGGHTLTTEFLNKFNEINCYDPDPLAHYIFKKNHPINLTWKTKNFYLELNTSNNCSYLFANLLGQLPASLSSQELDDHNIMLKSFLNDKSWASYHDVYSWNTKDQKHKDMPVPQSRNFQSYFEDNLKPHSEVIDHQTQFISSWSDHRQFFLWPLTPKRMHLIECCFKD